MFELSTIHERVNDSTESMNFRSLIQPSFLKYIFQFSVRDVLGSFLVGTTRNSQAS